MLWNFLFKERSKKVIPYLEWLYDEDIQEHIRLSTEFNEEISEELKAPYLPFYVHNVFDFYDRIKTQWNVGFDGLIGLNYQSIVQMSKVFDFELSEVNMMIIQEIELFIVEKSRKKNG